MKTAIMTFACNSGWLRWRLSFCTFCYFVCHHQMPSGQQTSTSYWFQCTEEQASENAFKPLRTRSIWPLTILHCTLWRHITVNTGNPAFPYDYNQNNYNNHGDYLFFGIQPWMLNCERVKPPLCSRWKDAGGPEPASHPLIPLLALIVLRGGDSAVLLLPGISCDLCPLSQLPTSTGSKGLWGWGGLGGSRYTRLYCSYFPGS